MPPVTTTSEESQASIKGRGKSQASTWANSSIDPQIEKKRAAKALAGACVVVRLSGEVVKRKKKLSKKLYGTSHVPSEDEAKFLFEKGCDQVVIDSGQMGNVHLSPEAEAYFERKGCEVVLEPTPEAIRTYNRSRARRIGLFHVTC